MIKHILCPVALKTQSHIALQTAIEIAHQLNAKITLLNIHKEFMDKHELEMLRVSAAKMMEKFEAIAKKSRLEMQELIHKYKADDIEVEYLLHNGIPEKMIAKVAKELKVDLIVMYTSGRTNIKDFVTGTISQHVINSAHCPVLVIPHKK